MGQSDGRSAILIRVEELAPLIGRWWNTTRAAIDGMPPHITLLYPWRMSPLADGDLRAVAAAFVGVEAFDLTLTRLARFPDAVYLVPEPAAELRNLMDRLFEAFPETPPYEGRFTDVIPHLTVVTADEQAFLDDLEPQIASALVPELPFRVHVSDICIDEPGVAPEARWVVRARIPLS